MCVLSCQQILKASLSPSLLKSLMMNCLLNELIVTISACLKSSYFLDGLSSMFLLKRSSITRFVSEFGHIKHKGSMFYSLYLVNSNQYMVIENICWVNRGKLWHSRI